MAFVKQLGSGSQGEVDLCLFSKSLFCKKRLGTKTAFEKEKAIMISLRGLPNVAQLFEEKDVSVEENCIPIKFYRNGDLFTYVEAAVLARGYMDDMLAKTIFRQILIGLSGIHDSSISHRDVKPQNIFVDENHAIYIGDFGMSKRGINIENGHEIIHGTLDYIAPEVFTEASYDGKAADVWSSGCLLFQMLTGLCPFGEAGAIHADWFVRQLRGKKKAKFWQAHQRYCRVLEKDCKEFLEQMLTIDASQRATVIDLLSHPWMQTILSEEDYGAQMSGLALTLQGAP